jgi:drug/metabolite transporter (DMT)-like permease
VLYVSLLASLVAFFSYNHAASKIGTAQAGHALALMPLFGAFLAVGLLGEPLHLFHLAGMMLILTGGSGRRPGSSAGEGANPVRLTGAGRISDRIRSS